jgi:hypothetical protein
MSSSCHLSASQLKSMWGFTTKQPAADPESPTFEIKYEFTDDDLNDPSLLAELAKLNLEPEVKKKPAPFKAAKPIVKKKPVVVKESEPVVDVDEMMANIHAEGDVDVQVTDDDMNDPRLLVNWDNVGRTSFNWRP